MKTLPDARPSPTGSAVTSGLPGLTARDAERIAAAIEAELAASTRAVYASAWRQWEVWCAARGVPALPSPPAALAAYLAERAEQGLTYSSIDVACCAVSYWHRQHGLIDPTTDPTLRRVRRGLRRIIGVAPRRQAHPLDVTELTQIVTAIDSTTPHGLRDRAIILLGYAAAVRPGEVAALRVADIAARPGGLLITIRRSKTEQEGLGQMIGVVRGTKATTDPVTSFARLLKVRPRGSGPLFTRIQHDGSASLQPICARTVSRMIQASGQAAGPGHLPSPGTHFTPAMPPPPQPTARRSTDRHTDETPRSRDAG